MDGIDLVASAALRFGDRAVVESPGFPPLLDLLDCPDPSVTTPRRAVTSRAGAQTPIVA